MINFDILRSYLDNDDDIVEAVLMAYVEEHSESIDKLQLQFSTQNWSELFMTAHSLKGILASFGEDTAVDVLERIEGQTRDSIAPDDSDVAVVVTELGKINKQVDDFLASLG
ncbi:histidine phosphotransferase [Vibrio sp. 10N.286.49.B3]|uniref:Hpt domain-containing protein n=1 Tax=Vibrio sp. 10N.286.49.B3 TaxID=1880855 RepID=UPI000C8230F4|nr:Hpt domain-containing protein [Vibrio sp. 10N.286.49.B3]PMH46578.1 histidine phosphotransferase [Vibrio sp. 10N.286.49.B3]